MKNIYLLIPLLLLSCFKEGPSPKKILKAPLSTMVTSIDPALAFDVTSNMITYSLYETLYQYDYLIRPFQIVPLLAKRLPDIREEGRLVQISLKDNIFYHPHPLLPNNRKVRAEDFITQFKRLAFQSTRSTGWWLFDGKIKGLNEFRQSAKTLDDFLSIPIEGLKALDPSTLQIELTTPYPQLLNALAMVFTAPLPSELIKPLNNDFSSVSVGTGPFLMESYKPEHKVRLVRFEQYHHQTYPSRGDRWAHSKNYLVDANKKIPFLDEIQFEVIQEDQTRWLQFVSGNLSFLEIPRGMVDVALTGSELKEELKKKKIQLDISPSLTYWWLGFNLKDPVVGKNKNLRKAIAHAINWDVFIERFTNNIGLKSNSLFPPGIPGYDPSQSLPYFYSIEKAQEFLVSAGFPKGRGLPPLKFAIRDNSSQKRQMGEFIVSELQKIGLSVSLEIYNFPQFIDKARKGELQFWQDGWVMDYPDAQNILQLLYSKNHAPGPNKTFFDDPVFDELYEKLILLPEGEEKWELMHKMEEIVLAQVPWVMMYVSRNYILLGPEVRNLRYSEMVFNMMKYVNLQD